MESRTPVKLLTGVRMGDSRGAGCVPYVNNTTGALHSHQVHSTMTDLHTPVYNSAPKGESNPSGVHSLYIVLFLFSFYNIYLIIGREKSAYIHENGKLVR